MDSQFVFAHTKELFLGHLRTLTKNGSKQDLPRLKPDLQKKLVGEGEADKKEFGPDEKSTLELAFQIVIAEVLGSSNKTKSDTVELLLELALHCAENDLLEDSAPHTLLDGVFELQTISECHHTFSFLASRLSSFIQPKLFQTGKRTGLAFLKACNSLLRRLSKTNDTAFCGQVLMLLSHVFPLDERSGLNLEGAYNTANGTEIETIDLPPGVTQDAHKPGIKEESTGMNIDSGSGSESKESKASDGSASASGNKHQPSLANDLQFYKTLWGVQQFFSNPPLLATASNMSQFLSSVSQILDAFEGSKLTMKDSVAAQQALARLAQDTAQLAKQGKGTKRVFFPKYLTSSRLLNLQLRDPMFRRYVLVQTVILFNFLLSTSKKALPLQASIKEQIKARLDKTMAIIKETPPQGADFAKDIEHLMNREKFWTAWKDSSCPPMTKLAMNLDGAVLVETAEDKAAREPAPKRRKPSKPPKLTGKDARITMGSAELNRLWLKSPGDRQGADLLDDAEDRQFVPPIQRHYDTMIDEEDPANAVEDDYKRRNDRKFQWRTLRLLAMSDFTLFQKCGGNLAKILPDIIPKPAADAKAKTDAAKEVSTAAGTSATSSGKDSNATEGKAEPKPGDTKDATGTAATTGAPAGTEKTLADDGDDATDADLAALSKGVHAKEQLQAADSNAMTDEDQKATGAASSRKAAATSASTHHADKDRDSSSKMDTADDSSSSSSRKNLGSMAALGSSSTSSHHSRGPSSSPSPSPERHRDRGDRDSGSRNRSTSAEPSASPDVDQGEDGDGEKRTGRKRKAPPT